MNFLRRKKRAQLKILPGRMDMGKKTVASIEGEIDAARRHSNGSRRFMLVEGRLIPRNPSVKYTRRHYINVDDIRDFSTDKITPKFGSASLENKELFPGEVTGSTGLFLPEAEELKPILYTKRTYMIKKASPVDPVYFHSNEFSRLNLMRFKNVVLYSSRGLPIPKKGLWHNFSDCRANGVCIIRHLKIHVRRVIVRIIMENDPLITHADAEMIYLGLRRMLEVKDYEYFFNRYILNEDVND